MILKDSFHHPKHKIAAFQNYCFRAHDILTNKNDLNKEINVIKTLAKNNGYQTETIDTIIKNLENKNAKPKDKNKYLGAIPHIGFKTDKITKVFKQHNIMLE